MNYIYVKRVRLPFQEYIFISIPSASDLSLNIMLRHYTYFSKHDTSGSAVPSYEVSLAQELVFDIDNSISKIKKEWILYRPGKEFSKHISFGAVLHINISWDNPIVDEEVKDVYMPCSLADGPITILPQQDNTLVILILDVLLEVVALGFKKVTGQSTWGMILLDYISSDYV